MGVPHPQGCPDGGQLEEDPPPLLGTDTSQLGRAHLQQLVPRQHPQGPHGAAGGTGVSRARLHPRVHPRGFWGAGAQGTTYIREKPLSTSQAVTSAGEELGCRVGGLSWSGDKGRRHRGGLPLLVGAAEKGGERGSPPVWRCAQAPGGAPGCYQGRVPCPLAHPAPATISSAGPRPRRGDKGDRVEGQGPGVPNSSSPPLSMEGTPRFYLQRVPLPDAQLLRIPGLEVVEGSDQPLGRERESGSGKGVDQYPAGGPDPRIRRGRGHLHLSGAVSPVGGRGLCGGQGQGRVSKGSWGNWGRRKRVLEAPVAFLLHHGGQPPVRKYRDVRGHLGAVGVLSPATIGDDTGVGVVAPAQIQTSPSRCRRAGPHLDLLQAVPRLFQTP